jgi:hypothetical protein
MEKEEKITTRWPGENVQVGPFVAKVNFDPRTGAPISVFIMARAKSGSHLDDFLYDLSTEISRVMQRKPQTQTKP